MSDVFISYSRENTIFIKQLVEKFEANEKEAWVDWEGIPLTAPNWWTEIQSGIANADSFVYIMSPTSVASVVCNLELAYALEIGKRIIPVVYQEADVEAAFAILADVEPDPAMEERLEGRDPVTIARNNWQSISHINWLFINDDDDDTFDDDFENLLNTLATDLPYVKAHTRYLTRAQEWERENNRPDLLLFGEEIEKAEEWLIDARQYADEADTRGDATVTIVNPLPLPVQLDYIAASQRERLKRRVLSSGAVGVISVLVIALMIGFFIGRGIVSDIQADVDEAQATLEQANQDIEAAQAFAQSLRLSARAEQLANVGSPAIALAVALEANEVEDAPTYSERVLTDIAYAQGVQQEFRLHRGIISSVTYSADGRLIASGSWDGTINVIDLANLRLVSQLRVSANAVTAIDFNGDASQIAAGYSDGTTQIWDVETGEILLVLSQQADEFSAVTSLDFNPDSTQLVVGYSNGLARVWDTVAAEIVHELNQHTAYVTSVSFNATGDEILSSSEDRSIIVWDAASGAVAMQYTQFAHRVPHAIFSPDGNYILAGSCSENTYDCTESTFLLIERESQQVVRTYQGHDDVFTSMAFSPDGSQFITASDDQTLIMWETFSDALLGRYYSHQDVVGTVAYSPDGSSLLSGADDGAVILWGIHNGAIEKTIPSPREDWRIVITRNWQLNELFYTDSDQHVIRWDVENRDELTRYQGHTRRVTVADISSDDTLLVTGDASGKVILWEIESGRILYEWLGHSGGIHNLEFNSDDSLLVSSALDGQYIVWNLETGEEIARFGDFSRFVGDAIFSVDDETLFVALQNHSIIQVDWRTEEILQTFVGHEDFISSLAVHPDGERLMSGSWDSSAIVWDIETGDLLQRLVGHQWEVKGVHIPPAGNHFISAGSDWTLILWDAETGEIKRQLRGHRAPINGIQASDDGNTIITIADDDMTFAWRVDTMDEVLQWIAENRFVPQLSCQAQRSYGFDTDCEADDSTDNQLLISAPPNPEADDSRSGTLLQEGIGRTNGDSMSNGEVQVEYYCQFYGLGQRIDSDGEEWYCRNASDEITKTLDSSDFTQICLDTYDVDVAYARPNGPGDRPAWRWRCYAG